MTTIGGMIQESAERLQLSIDALSTGSAENAGLHDPETATSGLGVAARRPVDGLDTTGSSGLIRLETVMLGRCTALCRCQCHGSRQVRNRGTLFHTVIGRFLLDYNCIPIWDPRPCDDLRCLRSGPAFVKLVYLFPRWLLGRSLHVCLSWNSLIDQGAALHLSVPRVLHRSHDIFAAIQNSRLDRVKSILSSRQALPTDVDELGRSLLFVAIANTAIDLKIAEILLPLTGDLISLDSTGGY